MKIPSQLSLNGVSKDLCFSRCSVSLIFIHLHLRCVQLSLLDLCQKSCDHHSNLENSGLNRSNMSWWLWCNHQPWPNAAKTKRRTFKPDNLTVAKRDHPWPKQLHHHAVWPTVTKTKSWSFSPDFMWEWQRMFQWWSKMQENAVAKRVQPSPTVAKTKQKSNPDQPWLKISSDIKQEWPALLVTFWSLTYFSHYPVFNIHLKHILFFF